MKIILIVVLKVKINPIFVYMKAFVYAIKCPVLKRIIYVGATINTKTRFNAHRYGSKRSVIGMYIIDLKSKGMKVEFEILEEITLSHPCMTHELYTAEQNWIKTITDKGIDLLNQKYGPKGPRTKKQVL